MNKSDLIAKMTVRLSGDRGTAAAAVNGVLEEIEGSLARGERVSLTGFGTFDRRERASRTARNPRTGEAIRVGPSVVPVFRAGTSFKALLTQSDGGGLAGASDAVERSVGKAKKEKSMAAASAAPAVVTADAAAEGKKRAGKNARVQPAEKGGKSARKTSKSKAGKKAAKAIR